MKDQDKTPEELSDVETKFAATCPSSEWRITRRIGNSKKATTRTATTKGAGVGQARERKNGKGRDWRGRGQKGKGWRGSDWNRNSWRERDKKGNCRVTWSRRDESGRGWRDWTRKGKNESIQSIQKGSSWNGSESKGYQMLLPLPLWRLLCF
ncbi:hypothetical protein J1605_006735 [Eschrichtius robustus]|uniref:Uncharacterized protein n=1 Tax=Eschrichtius robustus TaxID=9764 RepID=A0AB34H532_ESCRO|nr:hypothetical protein J1605_006735 [Eschrichtius robustus]